VYNGGMSGPVTRETAPPLAAEDRPSTCDLEVVEPRRADVGGFEVERVLPRRARRMVGAWCFADHMIPGQVDDHHNLDIGPHPHIGLQTVTWLVDGAVLHRDSLGTEQVIRPGQLNLMTAGHGVSHSEETRGIHVGRVHGVQLWVAQPTTTRDGTAAFEHHADLPRLAFGASEATVLVGALSGVASPARRDTDHMAAEVNLLQDDTVVPLDPSHEHAVLPLSTRISIGGVGIERGHLGYLGVGRDEVALRAETNGRVLLIGGEPFRETLLMWWNYVARERAEILQAHEEWTERGARFGRVASPLERMDAPTPPSPA
jgi:redox-sensitive bicupin YhaK (pirin superfamily)